MPVEQPCPRLLMETRCEAEQLTSPRSCRSIVRHVPKLSLLAHARSNKAPEHCPYRQIANGARVRDPLADVLHPDYSSRFCRNDFRDHRYARLYKKSNLDDSVRDWPRMPGSVSPLDREAGWHRQAEPPDNSPGRGCYRVYGYKTPVQTLFFHGGQAPVLSASGTADLLCCRIRYKEGKISLLINRSRIE